MFCGFQNSLPRKMSVRSLGPRTFSNKTNLGVCLAHPHPKLLGSEAQASLHLFQSRQKAGAGLAFPLPNWKK